MSQVAILTLDPWYKLPFGGTQQAVYTLAEGLLKQPDTTVYVLAPRGSQLPPGARLVDLGPTLLDRGITWRQIDQVVPIQRQMLDKIEEIIRQHQRDRVVLHVQWSYSEASLLHQILERNIQTRVPVLLTKHTLYPSLLSDSQGWDQSLDAQVIGEFPTVAISQHDRRQSPKFFKVIKVITHGLPDVYFSNPWPSNRRGGGCIGTYAEDKGFLVSYQAAHLAGETRFESVGIANAPEHHRYRDRIKRGYLDKGFGRDLGEIDLATKLLWLPSLRYLMVTIRPRGKVIEPLNYTVREAHASGLLVIANYIGAMPELIQEGVNGFLVSQDNVPHMAEHIHYINSLPDGEMAAWSRRIREATHQYYSSYEMGWSYMQVYDLLWQ